MAISLEDSGLTPAARYRTPRKRLYALHAWVGFHLAIIMSVILFTGTMATISNEIDWLATPQLRVTPNGEFIGWSALEQAAQSHSKEHTIISIFAMGEDYLPYRARMMDEHGRHYFLHINQWTGAITGTSSTLTVQRFFRDLHRYLYMPNFIGLPLVTAFAFVLAISLYTGLKTARNWRTLAFRVRTANGLRIMLGDAHKAYGLWGSWFIVLMIATSVWYLAEFGGFLAGQRFEPERPKLSNARVVQLGSVIGSVPLIDVVNAAKQAFPELQPTSVFYPITAQQPYTVLGRVDNVLVRDRANRVFLDPVSLEPLVVQKASAISWTAWINEIADPLHFGYFGGLATKLIWFVFGCGLTGLSLTGVWLSWRRIGPTGLSRTQIATLPILALSLAFAVPWYQRLVGPTPPDAERALLTKTVDQLAISVFQALDSQDQRTNDYRLSIQGAQGRPNVQKIALKAGDSVIHEQSVNFIGQQVRINFVVSEEEFLANETLNLAISLNSGSSITTQVPLREVSHVGTSNR